MSLPNDLSRCLAEFDPRTTLIAVVVSAKSTNLNVEAVLPPPALVLAAAVLLAVFEAVVVAAAGVVASAVVVAVAVPVDAAVLACATDCVSDASRAETKVLGELLLPERLVAAEHWPSRSPPPPP